MSNETEKTENPVAAGSVGSASAIPAVSFMTLFPSIMVPMFLAMVDQTIVATALPAMAASLGNVEQIAWVVVAYLISMAIAAPVYGRLGDAFGRRRLMIVALIVSIAGSLLCAVSVSLEMLIAARVLQGLGGGGLMSLSQALIGQSVQPRERAQYQGYVSAVAMVASTLGPVLGGVLTEFLGWRSIFLVNIPLGLLAIFLVMKLPGRRGPREAFRFDWGGLIFFTGFVWALLVLVEQSRRREDMDPYLIAALAVTVVVTLLLLYWREKRALSPLFPIPIMRNPTIWRSDLLVICHGGIIVSLITFLPLYFRVVRGASAAETGLYMLPMVWAIGVGALITGQIVSRTGRLTIFPSVGLSVFSVMLALLALIAGSLTTLQFSIYIGAAALFLGTVMGVVHVTVTTEVGGKLLGTVSATVQLSRSLGAAFGTALVSAVLFAVVAMTGADMGGPLQAILQGDAAIVDQLNAGDIAAIRADVATGFSAVYMTIAAMSAVACVLAWTIPRRTI
ncbi:MFS transporter [Fodinicurvata sp. EGI_FJ10296]|uniref:MFS transporter n=1 Tax=Fodinicurvata sp. EGI_FJ10296 TaxID=3231908 RepID=UPI003454676B